MNQNLSNFLNSNDCVYQYSSIASKIKKRFLKKPNLAEACEEFNKLGQNLSESDSFAQAGVCCIAVARCEQSLSNSSCEVLALLDAGRNFMKAEFQNYRLMCPSFNEHMASAISCYETAIKLYKDQDKPALAGSVALELSKDLQKLENNSQALKFLEEASDCLKNSLCDYLYCLNEKAACLIDLGDLVGAMDSYTQIQDIFAKSAHDKIEESLLDIAIQCELCLLFLILILQPLANHMKPENKKFLQKYLNQDLTISTDEFPFEEKELLIYLQSLALSCKENDTNAITALSPFISTRLSGHSLRLFHALVVDRESKCGS